MKKTVICCLIFILCLLFILPSDCYASGQAVKDYFMRPSKNHLNNSIDNISSNIYLVLKSFGIILAACIMVTISISYMVATPQKRAALKERLVIYFAGVIFLLAGTAFLNWYENVARKVGDVVGDSANYSGYSSTPSKSICELEGHLGGYGKNNGKCPRCGLTYWVLTIKPASGSGMCIKATGKTDGGRTTTYCGATTSNGSDYCSLHYGQLSDEELCDIEGHQGGYGINDGKCPRCGDKYWVRITKPESGSGMCIRAIGKADGGRTTTYCGAATSNGSDYCSLHQ